MEKYNFKILKNNYPYYFLLVVLFFIIRLKSFSLDVYFPDEIWHAGYMRDMKDLGNYQGFGSLYWLMGNIFSRFTEDYKFILRIIALFCIGISGLFVGQLFKAELKNKIIIMILYFSTPFLWYGGKLITPEFYLLPIVFYALKLILIDNKFRFPFLLLGFAIGIKSSIVPIIISVTLYYFYSIRHKNIFNLRILTPFFLCIGGFILASPNLLWNPVGFYMNIPRRFNLLGDFSANNGMPEILSLSFYINKLLSFYQQAFLVTREWDLVISTGFFVTVFSLSTFLILSFFIFIRSNRFIFLSYLISLITYFYIMLLQGFFIWHYYSIIPIVFFHFAQTYNNHSHSFISNRFLKNFFFTLMILSILVNINNISKFYSVDNLIKKSTYEIIKNREINTNCLLNDLENYEKEQLVIINATDFLKNSKGMTIIDDEKIKKSGFNIFNLSSSLSNKDKIYLSELGPKDKVFSITFDKYDDLKNFNRDTNSNYFESYISRYIPKTSDVEIMRNCNGINLSEIKFDNPY